ncbi:10536_t:CDS:2, partial [Acaulospora colombiana]
KIQRLIEAGGECNLDPASSSIYLTSPHPCPCSPKCLLASTWDQPASHIVAERLVISSGSRQSVAAQCCFITVSSSLLRVLLLELLDSYLGAPLEGPNLLMLSLLKHR